MARKQGFMTFCRVSAVRILEKELLSGQYQETLDAVNETIQKSPIHLDQNEKYELIRIADEQKQNDMIMKYFV